MNMSDYTAVRKLEAFNEIIYKKMERRKAAIQNWQRMKVLLAILKICGNRMEKKGGHIAIEIEETNVTFNQWMAKYIITPRMTLFQIFAVLSSIGYMISAFLDPFILGFRLQPLLDPYVKLLQTWLSFAMLIDITLLFITALPKEAIVRLEEQPKEM